MLITIGNHISKARIGSKLNALEPELTTYMDGLITPLSSGQKTKLNDFIKALKTGLNINALSDAFDVMYVLGNETAESSLRNLVKRAHDATAVNSPAFTALEGFKGNGTSSYLNTNYKQSVNGVNSILNDTSLGIYSRTLGVKSLNIIEMGARSSSSSKATLLQSYITNSRIGIALNTGMAVGGTPGSITNDPGFVVGSRKVSNTVVAYKNGVNIETIGSTSSAVSEFDMFIFALNDGGTPVGFSEQQHAFAFVGKGLTDVEVLTITDAFEAYMDSNGKGVIA